MKIVLTGVTGFIANAIVERLLNEGHQVYAIVRPQTDLSKLQKDIGFFVDDGNTEKLNSFFNEILPDGVLHLASLVLVNHNLDDIESLIISNVLFSTRLLEASVNSKVKWFINTGTFWQHYNNEDYNPVNLYAATKQAFIDIAKYYYETQKINFVTIKLNDTFGSNDTRSKIFNLWGRAVQNEENLGMSAGEQIIDISYIDNIVDAYMQMLSQLQVDDTYKYAGEVFAVNSEERMSLKELARVYEEVTHATVDITWGGRPYRDREVMIPWTKGQPVPGWKQNISLRDAIAVVMNKGKE
jgi:nucleoside-diphosphate-sugar epimerase